LQQLRIKFNHVFIFKTVTDSDILNKPFSKLIFRIKFKTPRFTYIYIYIFYKFKNNKLCFFLSLLDLKKKKKKLISKNNFHLEIVSNFTLKLIFILFSTHHFSASITADAAVLFLFILKYFFFFCLSFIQ
jgi:hypothetical protein